MARELTGSEQARRAGLWDGVRPEALVPRERDPLTGSLSGRADPDGGAKDRRTESSAAEASAPGPRVPRGRWPIVAAAGAAALVVGVGGAVALSNRDSADTGSGPGTTGAAGAGATTAPAGGTAASPTATSPAGPQQRSYEGTFTSTIKGNDSSVMPMQVGVSCTDTECRLLGWSPSGRPLTWAPGETVVTLTLPQIGEVTNMCEGKEDFDPEASYVMTLTDEAMSFVLTRPEATAQCGGGSSVSTSGGLYEFDGTRIP